MATSITHILPIYSAPLPGQTPEDHVHANHQNMCVSVTKLFQRIFDLEKQIAALQAQKKGQ